MHQHLKSKPHPTSHRLWGNHKSPSHHGLPSGRKAGAHTALGHLTTTLAPALPPLAHSLPTLGAPAPPASLLLLPHKTHDATSGPWHWLLPPLECPALAFQVSGPMSPPQSGPFPNSPKVAPHPLHVPPPETNSSIQGTALSLGSSKYTWFKVCLPLEHQLQRAAMVPVTLTPTPPLKHSG